MRKLECDFPVVKMFENCSTTGTYIRCNVIPKSHSVMSDALRHLGSRSQLILKQSIVNQYRKTAELLSSFLLSLTTASLSSTPLESFSTQPVNVSLLSLEIIFTGMVVFSIHLSPVGS